MGFYGSAEWIGDNMITVSDGKGSTFDIDVKDLFSMSAVTVSNTIGKGDPVYRVARDTGSVYEEKIYSLREGETIYRAGKSYKVMVNNYFSGDTQEKTIARQNNIDSYNTVGGIAQE